MTIDDIFQQAGPLPAIKIAQHLNTTLHSHNVAVVTAPPGAGKSTLLPLTLMTEFHNAGKILMLEPRRIAARQIAERMAHILNEPVGQSIGYRVRFESKISSKTCVDVLTEGIRTRMLVDDATLEGVSVVIFDEFHERSLHADLALALTHQTQQLVRPDLKIVIMSATIDTAAISKTLMASVLQSQGKMFPVEVRYTDINHEATPTNCAQAVASTICQAHQECEGDILAFLPGQADIIQCIELLGDSLAPTKICPLYGNLTAIQQRQAIAPSKPGERKIVLATPIAETSITIEGVRIVVDSGLYRTPIFDARTALTHLKTERISLDMATQRTGRAGRVAPGICYRLWTKATEHLMKEQRKTEIETADLAPTLLSISAFGETDVIHLPWLTPPPAASLAQATALLTSLGAINSEGIITPRGRRMATLPCHPRIASMITNAHTTSDKALACDIAALLEEKDPMVDRGEADFSIRISTLRSLRRRHQLGIWKRIEQIAHDYRRMIHANEDNTDIAPQQIGLLLAHAYPERIAMSVNDIGLYKLSNGTQVQLNRNDALTAHTWITVASLHATTGTTGTVFLAAPLNPDDLSSDFTTQYDNISWDSKHGCVVMQQELRIGKLIISSKPIHNASTEQIINIVCEAVKKEGLSLLNWSDEVQYLQRRVATVAAWHPEMQVPDLSTQHLLDTANQWLPLYLIEGNRIIQNSVELKKINLREVLWNNIPYELQLTIDRLAPTHLQVPTGSHIRIDYRTGAEAPVLSVRLQECFGMKQTPCVDEGRQPILIELLSPGFKPVQLTQDLHSFWQNAYFEVRKELRRRYPKHYWPENPMEAEAVRGVKKREK